MHFKKQLQKGLKVPRELLSLLPAGYQRIGNIIVVNIHPTLEPYEKEIGNTILKHFSVQSVFKKGPIKGELRIPQVKKIAGKGSVTIHRENGCLFKIDVSKLMFSKGNVFERGRIRARGGEVIIDMFGGIGYFSLPLAKKNPHCTIYAIEKNPLAVRFLKENLTLNRVKNIRIIEGDCRGVQGIKADRILMGYLPGTEFLPAAFGLLKRKGIIHFHNVYRKEELWKRPFQELEAEGRKKGYLLEHVAYKNVVKQVAPRTYHVVVDAKFKGLKTRRGHG